MIKQGILHETLRTVAGIEVLNKLNYYPKDMKKIQCP